LQETEGNVDFVKKVHKIKASEKRLTSYAYESSEEEIVQDEEQTEKKYSDED